MNKYVQELRCGRILVQESNTEFKIKQLILFGFFFNLATYPDDVIMF